MSLEVDIRDAINALVRKNIPIISEPCEVLTVDEDKGVCDVQPLTGRADVLDVLLNAGGDKDTSVTIVPKVGSVVYITYYDKNNAFVSLISELDKIFIENTDVSLEISDKVKLNGDSDGGLTITPTLRTELNLMKARIGTLEALVQTFATAQEAVAVATPLFAPLSPAWVALKTGISGLPPQGTFSDNIESKKVVQG